MPGAAEPARSIQLTRSSTPEGGETACRPGLVQRLEQELAKARFVMDVQAKLQALLEKLSESEDTGPK